jgi:hypothetical protein
MIEAFIRGDNRPSRDLLAADPSLIHLHHPEFGSAGHVSRAQQKLTSMVPEFPNRPERLARCILE